MVFPMDLSSPLSLPVYSWQTDRSYTGINLWHHIHVYYLQPLDCKNTSPPHMKQNLPSRPSALPVWSNTAKFLNPFYTWHPRRGQNSAVDTPWSKTTYIGDPCDPFGQVIEGALDVECCQVEAVQQRDGLFKDIHNLGGCFLLLLRELPNLPPNPAAN